MHPARISAIAAVVVVLHAGLSQAQMTVFRPSYSPVVVTAPAPVLLPAPIPVTTFRPVVMPAPIPVTTYRPIIMPAPVVAPVVHTTVAPMIPTTTYVAGYGVARPVVVAPTVPVVAPVVSPIGVPTTLYRPTVVGPGIAGLPNVYVPGQPVRNALRFALP
jgi:hypothetical protein